MKKVLPQKSHFPTYYRIHFDGWNPRHDLEVPETQLDDPDTELGPGSGHKPTGRKGTAASGTIPAAKCKLTFTFPDGQR